MYHLELLDLLFVLKCLKDPSDNIDIFNYISYSSGPTRSSTSHKLELKFYRFSSTRHQYFNRVVMLWNTFSPIDLPPSFTTIKKLFNRNSGIHSPKDSTPAISAHFVVYVPVLNVTHLISTSLCLPQHEPIYSFLFIHFLLLFTYLFLRAALVVRV